MKFAISGIFIKNIPNGLNIQGDLEIVTADSVEAAIGLYILEMNKRFPGSQLFKKPMYINLDEMLKEPAHE